MNSASNTVSARAKYIRMSPTKVRRVLKQIDRADHIRKL